MLVSVSGAVVLYLPGLAAGEGESEALARTAKEALSKKDFAKAAAAFELAWVEEPARLDLLMRCAENYEKSGRPDAALLAYRAFQAAHVERAKKMPPAAKAKSASRKALKRIKALGKLEAKEATVRDRSAAKLVAFAEKCASEAPVVALRALERAALLASDPESFGSALRKLRARVDRPADRVKSPFEKAVKTWTDLLATGTFPETTGWTFGEVGLVIENKAGSAEFAGSLRTTAEPFVYEMEVRTEEAYGAMWVVGLMFGRAGPKALSAWLGPKGVDSQSVDGPSMASLAAVGRPLDELGVWHRVSVLVKGGAFEIWVDGEKIATPKIPAGWSQEGQLGVTTQGGRFEIRELRMGVTK